jgi:hypothetical protein
MPTAAGIRQDNSSSPNRFIVSASDSDTVSHSFCRLMFWRWGIRKQFNRTNSSSIIALPSFPGARRWVPRAKTSGSSLNASVMLRGPLVQKTRFGNMLLWGRPRRRRKRAVDCGGGQGHNRRTLEQILQIVIAILGEPTNLDMPLFKSDMHVSAQPIDELEGSCSLSSR